MNHLNMKFHSFDGQTIILTMPVQREVTQPFGYLHGGATVALCETAASLGSKLLISDGEIPLGLEINANHIRSVTSGTVEVHASIVHKGQSTHIWQMEVVQGETLISISRATIAIKKK
ncbi:PaaI family thioesterase [Macrococcoides canis]|uniref:Hotdog fold thioesterase n=2 Tax=Macrococcoides canis TaxID=1855823 RepID=A0AAE7C038_9STAP|nr:PaaI family thioesterase [Macrococcus canis]QIH77864.1 hotdog fold thioesterase [Macrococcus canis]QNR09002.1 hotdog fold thioesterase [Macrococcus canis]QTQ09285.1 PaaI family thioesterase [Macrococcus canis]UTH01192.1 PaaI family thioesterase [Macrococcus canis]